MTWTTDARRLFLVLAALLAGGCQPQPAAQKGGTAAKDSATIMNNNDKLVLAAMRVALPPPGAKPADLPDPASAGAQNLARFCTRCHNLPTPTVHSATDWPSVIRRMWLRMDELPPEFGVLVPTPAERQILLSYLIKHALKVSGKNLPPGPGRETFSRECSRCHSLPDPRQHSSEDWPTVVMRMATAAQDMHVNRPPQQEVQEILVYLQGLTARRPTGARRR